MFCQHNLISKKAPNAKMHKKAKKKIYQTLKIFSSFVSLTRHFTKFIFLEQLTAMPQFNMQNMLLLFFVVVFFFLNSHHDTNPLLHLYHFRKKDNYILVILTVNHQESYFLFFFFFFLSSSSESNILYPSKFCNHLKHSAK